MLLFKLKTYLKTHLGTPSTKFEWSSEDNTNFFAYLNEHLPEESILDDKNQAIIKQAFKEYFEPAGYILLKMSQTQLKVKVLPYKTEPKDSVNLDAIIDIIDSNEDLIEYDYNGKKDLICIKKELSLKINSFIKKITDEEINKKELLKYGVRKAFELHQSDIVIIKNNQIFIKLFDNEKVREVSENEKNTIANRYNGLDESELVSFYNNFFLKEEHKNFFNFVAEQFVDIYLLEKQINNVTYEKYSFSLIQSIISEELVNTFDHSDEFFKGFSGYVFRIHFKEVFGHIANLILSEISASNKLMMDFLKYYSLNIVVLNGKKYKVPEIEAANGLKWNVASMMSIVKIYTKTDASLEAIKTTKETLDKEISELYIGELSPMEYNSNIAKAIEKISQELVYGSNRLNIYVDSLDSSNNEDEKATLKEDIKKIKHDLQLQRDSKAQLESKMISRSDLTKYNNLKKQIDAIGRQERREEKILSQNRSAYMSIKNSLVKALTSKKTLLDDSVKE